MFKSVKWARRHLTYETCKLINCSNEKRCTASRAASFSPRSHHLADWPLLQIRLYIPQGVPVSHCTHTTLFTHAPLPRRQSIPTRRNFSLSSTALRRRRARKVNHLLPPVQKLTFMSMVLNSNSCVRYRMPSSVGVG